ncbi:RNA polymerase II subunit 3 [Gurleya vavrai]
MPIINFKTKSKNYLTFSISKTNLSFANSFRRVLLCEIPTVAFDIVHIIQNTSVLPDDLLVHRLGLIPTYTTRDLIYSKDCMCDGFCAKCGISVTLDVDNFTTEIRTVTSKDLKIDGFETEEMADTTFDDTIIAKLSKNHHLQLSAIIRKGTGMMNAKWSPVTIIEYNYDKNNEMRHTKYWHEEDIEKEWPGVVEKKFNALKNVEEIEMGIEVLDGYNSVEIALKGLNVLQEKIERLKMAIENYSEIV